jgi:hypothetical protein
MNIRISVRVYNSPAWQPLAETEINLEGPATYIDKALEPYELGALVAQTVQDAQAKLNAQAAEEPQP